jgi:hypothetical protein
MCATTAHYSGSVQTSAEKAASKWEETPVNFDGQNITEKKKKEELK